MSRIIQTHLTIKAPPELLWDALLDLPRYGQWNPFITAAAGDVAVGERLEFTVEPPGGARMTCRPWVTDVQSYGYVEWLSRLVMPGILDGRHSFTLTRMTGGRTLLQQSATFTGILAPLGKPLWSGIRRGFLEMNVALAQHVDGTHGRHSG